MTVRVRVLLVCTLLCTVFVGPVVGEGSETRATVAPSGYAQVSDPANEPDPAIFVNTTSIDYGEVAVGESATASLTIRNDGEGTLRVKDFELGGDDAFSLALDSSAPATDGEIATSPNVTLEPGESEQVAVVFAPTTGESDSATLSIDSDDPDTPTVEVTLDGEGLQPNPPEIAVEPRSLSFETATIGEESVRTVTVSNTGASDLVIADQSIAPTDSGFELVTPLDETIPPGESDTLSVGFEPTTRNATAATLSLSTNAPDGTTVVYLASRPATADVSLTRTDNTTAVTATIRNATAGEPVSISVPRDPEDPAGTDVDSVSVTPARNGSFDLNVTAADQRPTDASTFEAPGSTEPAALGYLNVTHSIPNEDISRATIRYRVNQSELAELGAEPEDFSLYRRVNGTWVRVNTTFDREANGTYIFSGTASGLSEWTAATEVPRISVSDATANVTAITLEEAVEIRVLLNNTGGSDGRFEVELLQNGTVVERRDVAVSPETTSLVTFQRGFDQTGTYGIEVNDIFVAAIEVAEGEATVVEGGQATVTAANPGGSADGPGLLLVGSAAVVAGLVAVAGFGAYRVVGGGDSAGADSPVADGAVADTGGDEPSDESTAPTPDSAPVTADKTIGEAGGDTAEIDDEGDTDGDSTAATADDDDETDS